MAENKISIDTKAFVKLAADFRDAAYDLREPSLVMYRGSLPYMGAHEEFLHAVEALIVDYYALVEKDFRRCEMIARTFEHLDWAQTGIW